MDTLTLLLGFWRAALVIPEGEIPFTLTVEQCLNRYCFVIHNGSERLVLDDIHMNGDSMVVRFPVFDAELRLKVGKDSMSGVYVNHARISKKRIPMYAIHGAASRFPVPAAASIPSVEGRWRTVFSPGSADSTRAVALFDQAGSRVTGTFMTTTGDYRFLEGAAYSDSLFLSCFDGSHAFLFKARVQGDEMTGKFYSGIHWRETWSAWRDGAATLPHPDSLTFLKPGYDRLDFAFQDTSGKMVSLSDPAFRGKVKIIQVMGTWCPNCIDESVFLTEVFDKYPASDLAIAALAFEKSADQAHALGLIRKFQDNIRVPYPVLWAGNRSQANDKLPMVDKIMAFPTTFILDRQDRVRRIHTGFYGPATGDAHEKFRDDFHAFILKLLNEY